MSRRYSRRVARAASDSFATAVGRSSSLYVLTSSFDGLTRPSVGTLLGESSSVDWPSSSSEGVRLLFVEARGPIFCGRGCLWPRTKTLVESRRVWVASGLALPDTGAL